MAGDESIEGAVVVFPGALGDLLLAWPALRVLRQRHRRAHLTLVVAESLRALAALLGVADAVASLDDADGARLFAGDAAPRWLAGRPVLYSWLGATDTALRGRVEALTTAARIFRVVRGPGARHAATEYLAMIGAPPVRGTAPRLRPPGSERARALLRTLAAPCLALHPGAGSPAKRWDAAGFAALARRWRHAGGAVVAIAGPAEGVASLPDAAEAREWPLPDLAALLAGAALYVGNDSGVSHLAGAVGVPGVVLFGPTEPRRWRPRSPALRALRARSGALDLAALPVERVLAACERRALVATCRRAALGALPNAVSP